MGYQTFQLKDVYTFVREGDESGINTARLLNLSPEDFSKYLSQVKAQSPEGYGALLVKLYSRPQTRQKLLDAFV
jgi:hypothetical protein